MDSINVSMRYIYDQSTLFDVKIALEAVLCQCQDIDNTFANMLDTPKDFGNCYSMKSSEVTSNSHDDVVDESMVVGVVSVDASSASARESPVSMVAYNLEPSTDNIDLVSNVGHMLEPALHQPRDDVTAGSSSFANVTPIVQHHASFVNHDEKQAIVPISENCVDGDLCTDILCDHTLANLLHTTKKMVDGFAKQSSEVLSNLDDDGVDVTKFDGAIVDVATSTINISHVLVDDEFPMTVSVVANELVPITDSSGHVHNAGHAPYSTMDNFTASVSSTANATHTRHDEVWGKNSYMLPVEDWGVVSSEVFIRQHMVLAHSSFGCSYPCIRQGGCVVASTDRFLCFDPGILPVLITKPLHGYKFSGESAQSLYNQFLAYQCAMFFLVDAKHKAIYAAWVHNQFIRNSAMSVGSCFLGSSGRPPPSHYTAFELACLNALLHSLWISFRFEVKVHVELIPDHWGYSNWLCYEVLGMATEFAILPCGQFFLGSLEWPPPPHVPHGKYALLLHISVTAFGQDNVSAQCNSVATMEVPFALLPYVPQTIASVQLFVKNALQKVHAFIDDWLLRPPGAVASRVLQVFAVTQCPPHGSPFQVYSLHGHSVFISEPINSVHTGIQYLHGYNDKDSSLVQTCFTIQDVYMSMDLCLLGLTGWPPPETVHDCLHSALILLPHQLLRALVHVLHVDDLHNMPVLTFAESFAFDIHYMALGFKFCSSVLISLSVTARHWRNDILACASVLVVFISLSSLSSTGGYTIHSAGYWLCASVQLFFLLFEKARGSRVRNIASRVNITHLQPTACTKVVVTNGLALSLAISLAYIQRAVSDFTQGFYICISLWEFEAETKGPLTIHWVLLYPPFSYDAFYGVLHLLYCTCSHRLFGWSYNLWQCYGAMHFHISVLQFNSDLVVQFQDVNVATTFRGPRSFCPGVGPTPSILLLSVA